MGGVKSFVEEIDTACGTWSSSRLPLRGDTSRAVTHSAALNSPAAIAFHIKQVAASMTIQLDADTSGSVPLSFWPALKVDLHGRDVRAMVADANDPLPAGCPPLGTLLDRCDAD